jgi:hypothetical protein
MNEAKGSISMANPNQRFAAFGAQCPIGAELVYGFPYPWRCPPRGRETSPANWVVCVLGEAGAPGARSQRLDRPSPNGGPPGRPRMVVDVPRSVAEAASQGVTVTPHSLSKERVQQRGQRLGRWPLTNETKKAASRGVDSPTPAGLEGRPS